MSRHVAKVGEMSQSKVDRDLTLAALAKIVRAQQRGSLSDGLSLTRHATQIVAQYATEDDRAWLMKQFPGGKIEAQGFCRRRGKQRYEEAQYRVNLREPVDTDKAFYRITPRLEIWGIEVPHVCRDYSGRASVTGVVWRCTQHYCNQRITKTRARELGLLP